MQVVCRRKQSVRDESLPFPLSEMLCQRAGRCCWGLSKLYESPLISLLFQSNGIEDCDLLFG